MKERLIKEVVTAMSFHLNSEQSNQLINVLTTVFADIQMTPTKNALAQHIITNEKLVKNYYVCKKVNQMGDSSLKTYLYHIKKFVDFIRNEDLLKVDTNTVRLFLINLEKGGMSEISRDNVRRVLKAFYQWLVDEEYLHKNPVAKIPKIKEPQRIKRYFTELEIETIRDACINKRELALVDLLISSGLRVAEVSTIRISEINWDEGRFTVIGKRNKQRYGWMTVRAQKHIKEYLKERENKGIHSDFLFCRTRFPYDNPIGKEGVAKILKNIGKRCNIADIHVHGIRAFFATNLSDKGIPGETIQLLMGHDSYATTIRYYCRPNNDKAKNAVRTCV